MQKEIWKEIPGYEEHYQVSDQGNVRSLDREVSNRSIKGKVLKTSISKGYYRLELNYKSERKMFFIHQLVAMAFLNHKPDGTMNVVVDHRDNNPLNNNLSNLQLISQRENTSKDKIGYSSKYTGVTWNKRERKWKSGIRIKGKLKHLGYFKCELAAAAAYQKELIKLNK